jgi:hypothetical protein
MQQPRTKPVSFSRQTDRHTTHALHVPSSLHRPGMASIKPGERQKLMSYVPDLHQPQLLCAVHVAQSLAKATHGSQS